MTAALTCQLLSRLPLRDCHGFVHNLFWDKVLPINLAISGIVFCLCFIGTATRLHAEETVRFGSLYFPPFVESVGTPGKEGIAIERVRAIYRAMSKDVEITVLPWKRAQAMAEKGELHGLFPCGLIRNWEDKYALSNPVFIEYRLRWPPHFGHLSWRSQNHPRGPMPRFYRSGDCHDQYAGEAGKLPGLRFPSQSEGNSKWSAEDDR